ncbi:AbrB/MazE/SpoVT family DNA-binding domain-containing protein [Halomarina ordinaria]|uniref:AbrB/MazE/SpoVT family DNA-binding domain-containing protein n=1 Tax=Halomarina ordinaria TaxID=3033939 RepID=A0ABD5UA43_9EURY|nr:AbrB/MazE/SpoVT family DNA-binding domain-containing protein [Halomarina sp. PSRA2]
MTDERDGPMWPPSMFTRGMQEASEQAFDRQQEFFRQLLGGDVGGFPSQLGAMSQTAMFKTRVQSGGRISIPDAEREALDIEEGDIVQTVIVPIKRSRGDSDD